MINAQIADLSSHTTKYTSPALIQKVFANMRRVGKGFSGMDTLLFDGILVPQQVYDDIDAAAEDKDAAEPTLPSPTPATPPPPPPQQQLISSPPQVVPTPPLLPHQSSIAQPSSPPQQQPLQPSHTTDISIDFLNTLLETCTTLTKKFEKLKQDKIAQALKITKLKQRFRRLEKKRKLKASRLKRLRKVGTTQRVESLADTIMDDHEDASKQEGK
nr:hypothetical protein [Tanacetum cinerariifolium]